MARCSVAPEKRAVWTERATGMPTSVTWMISARPRRSPGLDIAQPGEGRELHLPVELVWTVEELTQVRRLGACRRVMGADPLVSSDSSLQCEELVMPVVLDQQRGRTP